MLSKGNKIQKGRVRFSVSAPDEDDVRAEKRPRPNNPDEGDDLDDWDDEVDADLPSSKELLEAKRKRRLQRQGEKVESTRNDDDDENETHIDKTTSLMEEKSGDIPIEAFNMESEKNDGSGFFDESGTYVFRKRNPGDEPDAWLESLGDEKQDFARRPDEPEEDTQMDDCTKEEMYANILPLVSESETVLQALIRYGHLIKQKKKSDSVNSDDVSLRIARAALNDLAGAANALLLKGDVDVYQMTKKDMMKQIPEPKAGYKVQWEYQGNQDNQVHGPYTTKEMLSWTQAGYFIKEQAVQIRTIKEEDATVKKSTKDELLSDLMDDEEEQATFVKGDWVSSNDVDFSIYS